MKKRLAVFLGLMLFAGVAAGCGGPAGKNDTYLLPDGYKELAVGRAMENATDGIGVEFDPHFYRRIFPKARRKRTGRSSDAARRNSKSKNSACRFCPSGSNRSTTTTIPIP